MNFIKGKKKITDVRNNFKKNMLKLKFFNFEINLEKNRNTMQENK